MHEDQYLCLECGAIGKQGWEVTQYSAPLFKGAKNSSRRFIGCINGCENDHGDEVAVISFDEVQEGFPNHSAADILKANAILERERVSA